MMTIQQEAEKNLQSGEMSEDSVAAFFEAKQGQIMEHLWKLNVADIEGTLTRVVDRVSLQSNTVDNMNARTGVVVKCCIAEV